MENSRVVFLVDALSQKERSELDVYLKKNARQSISILFDYISKKINERQNDKINKADAFYIVYKKPYTAQKDYLIRNDFRLLSSEINTFLLSIASQTTTWSNHCVYLQLLLERRKFNLFNKEYAKLEKKASKLPEFSSKYLQLQSVWIEYQMLLNIENEQKVKDGITALTGFINMQKANYAGKIAETLSKRARMEVVLNKIAPDYKPSSQIANAFNLQTEIDNKKAKYANYQLLKAKSYSLKGEAKINVLKELIDFAKADIFDSKAFFKNEIIILFSTIAVEYFILRQYKDAAFTFEKAINAKGFKTFVKRWDVLYNYVFTLLRSGNFSKAGQLLDTVPESISETSLAYKYQIMRALAEMFAKEYTKASKRLVVLEKSANTHDYIYLRILAIILNICKGDTENALREAQNFLQLSAAKHKHMTNYKTIIKFLMRYIHTLYYQESNKKEKIHGLMSEMNTMLQSPTNMQLDIIPLRLLERHLQRILDKPKSVF